MQTGHIIFAQPEWLWLLPLLLLTGLLLRVKGKKDAPAPIATGSTTQHSLFHPLISFMPGIALITKKKKRIGFVYTPVAILLILSLCEPIRIGERLPDPPQERDIVFIVDTSISMTLRDYVLQGERVDRMTMLKGVLNHFIQQLPGERMGIIVFGDTAYTLVPLTRDHSLLRRMLSRIEATMIGRFNAMGEGIALAVKQVTTQESALKENQGQRHRVLVLLTDADQPTGSIKAESAAQLAKEAGLPLYTVAIGATSKKAEEERVAGLLYEPVDLSLLEAISRVTGGRNYLAGDSQAFEQAIQDIARQESNKREQPPQYYRQPLYTWPLLIVIGILFLHALANALQRQHRHTTPREMGNAP
jgi:Ca-activated chloride channel family protein